MLRRSENRTNTPATKTCRRGRRVTSQRRRYVAWDPGPTPQQRRTGAEDPDPLSPIPVYRTEMAQKVPASTACAIASLLDADEVDMTSSQRGRIAGKMEENGRTVYEFSAPLLDGHTVSLGEFMGRVLVIVNTASQCGFTPQYAGLEQLYRTYKERGLEVLGFPCNQFGAQEPGSADEIGSFCERNYGVSFPMFAKIDVNGASAHPLYRFLKQSKPGILGPLGGRAIKWNFTKFLVDRNGIVVGRYASTKKPEDLAKPIEDLLGGK